MTMSKIKLVGWLWLTTSADDLLHKSTQEGSNWQNDVTYCDYGTPAKGQLTKTYYEYISLLWLKALGNAIDGVVLVRFPNQIK